MTQAITSRRDGDAFQARLFWIKAARLLDVDSNVVRVGFEHGPKGFDDLWIEFDSQHRPKNPFGVPLRKEYFQCKWHVTSGQYSHSDLVLPEFINATSVSLLQRAQGALRACGSEDGAICFRFLTNWRPDPNDRLATLIRNRSSTLSIDELFDGSTDRSATGKIRKCWREHLQIDDSALRQLAVALGFTHWSESLSDVRQRLDEACKVYGLARIPADESTVIYDDVVRQWAAQGKNVFDRESFREACASEHLLATQKTLPKVFGVKSLEHPIDRLEGRCVEVLNVVSEFDERFIRDDSSWTDTLFPELESFLRNAARSGERLRLVLDAHTTLAFAAGSILNTKSGRIIEIEQRSPTPKVWAPDDSAPSPDWATWISKADELDPRANDVAVAIGLTHDVEPQVRTYLSTSNLAVRSLLTVKPSTGSAQGAVASGAHAYKLAEDLSSFLKSYREQPGSNPSARLHLFIAAPNSFSFYFGRHVQTIRPLTLYEFDFEKARSGSYTASLNLPVRQNYP